jgi:hypothetical protein
MSKMKDLAVMLAASMAVTNDYKANNAEINLEYSQPLGYGDTLFMPSMSFTNAIYYPKKHTKQSYRSQQRARVKRNKARGK